MAGDKHVSSQFDVELSTISAHILEMGRTAASQVARALEALATFDGKLATEVLEAEERVNRMELEIDRELFDTIATRQPTARDLRLLLATSKATADLERIGDEAARIARTVQRLLHAGVSSRLRLPLAALAHEGELAVGQLRLVLDALQVLDVEGAVRVLKRDRLLDQEFEQLLRTLITFMMEDPRTISASIDLIFAARSIERVGDHAKNVAEQIIYIVKGADVRHHSVDRVEALAQPYPTSPAQVEQPSLAQRDGSQHS